MVEDLEEFDPENNDILMSYVLEHYLKHYEVVFKKLDHARDATQQSINELQDVSEQEEKQQVSEKLQEVQVYDSIWDNVITTFEDSGVSEDDLCKIEHVLSRIPQLIKKYYDVLIEQDEILQQLMTELQSDDYKRAIEITKQLQSKPDPLSGLRPSEFELDTVKEKEAFMFMPPTNKDSLH